MYIHTHTHKPKSVADQIQREKDAMMHFIKLWKVSSWLYIILHEHIPLDEYLRISRLLSFYIFESRHTFLDKVWRVNAK